MGLSRLDNFLKSVRGTILYVDPNSIDATDSIENQGNSLTRPFRTIQRALIEASRFSYQSGLDNDRFNKTTIVLYPGDHVVDNRPGWIPDGSNNYRLRNGLTSNNLPSFDLTSNFDLTTVDNELYKLNSVHGGVIVPRGTSIVGMDLRKTVIRPLYVPNPENDQIERSALFRVTGGCYFWQFSILDAPPNGTCFKDYTENRFVPNFSHHKLTTFEYADGVNSVSIADDFQTYSTNRTDLDMYYEKVGLVYGQASGRNISPDYPDAGLDIQPKVDEYRIVGSRGAEVGISSIRAGDGVTPSTTITVTLAGELAGVDVDTPIRIKGVGSAGYDGEYVVSDVIATGAQPVVEYQVSNPPAQALPSVSGSTFNISVDTVTSASPYIFNISLRSVYGMCGLHADGNKADGFKSMVVAQFTGIGLQKDDRAFVKYNTTTGLYEDSTVVENLHTDGLARYKPEYENYHLKTSNDSYIQVVSVFAIGYANHFLSESGGDQSITNSNSNFGAKALVASGFRKNAFLRDDAGYISHILPPKAIDNPETTVEYNSIDVGVTTSLGLTDRLYLYNQTNQAVKPDGIVGGYRLGAKVGDTLNTVITGATGISTEYSALVVMPNTEFTTSEKLATVGRNAGINSISNSTITLTGPHAFENGESVRIISETGHVPDGLDSNQVYFAITSGLGSDQIKVGQTLNDAIGLNPLTINNKGGTLNVISRVSDKIPGDTGHPVQYDVSNSQWYVNVSAAGTGNGIYSILNDLGTNTIGDATPRTYIKRTPDTRNIDDTIYRLRYVIPSDSATTAKPPLEGFVIQNSNTSIGSTNTEVAYQFNPLGATLSNSTELRNPRIIADARWASNTASIVTELPHELNVGSQVEILNITSSNNPVGTANSGFNNTFDVVGISSAKEFSVTLTTNPGTFTNNTSSRTTSLPYFKNKQYANSYYVYKSEEIQKYVPGEKDGIYHLLIVNTSNAPTVAPFTGEKFSQPIQNLYPQLNRDNTTSDPKSATSFALPTTIGQVVVDEPQKSITRETLDKALTDFRVGFALTDVISTGAAGTVHTLYSNIDHGLNPAATLNIVNPGTGYGVGSGNTEYYYNARLVGYAGSTTGLNATARVTVSAAGTISDIMIMDGGSAYGIGNTMSVVGIATTTSHNVATVSVATIIDNVGETLSINGVGSTTFDGYNGYYRITGISSAREVTVSSASTVNNATTSGVGQTLTSSANARLTGQALDVSGISYTQTTGIATVTTVQNHDLQVGKSVLLSGAEDSFYNRNFYVTQVVSQTQFVVNAGISGNHSVAGSIYAHKTGFLANSGNTSKSDENLGGRFATTYAGITTTISAVINDANATTIEISNVENFNFQIGDFLLVDEEIMRIKSTVTGNPVSVFRGLLGTGKAAHSNGAVITKIAPRPIEFRRNSLIRASGHTFEYVGYGPGNYSTAFPDRQTRNLTAQEEFLGQATRKESGAVLYTGMNDQGDYYVGGKKVSGTTGEEEVFDIPIPTVTGEDPTSGASVGFDRISSSEVAIERSLRVEGGPTGDIVSEFDGPVVFSNKLTSTSTKGIEANSIFLQGDRSVSRKFTVGVSEPTLAGTPGDVVYNGTPTTNGYTGWIYTTNSEWKPFGFLGGNQPLVGFSSQSSFIGLATSLDFRSGIGATIRTEYNATAGVGTVIVDASPLNVGVSTGLGLTKTFVGVATEINFIGYGVTISAVYNTSGIASVTFDATGGGTGSPGAPANSVQFNNSGFFGGSSDFSFDGFNVFVGNKLGIGNASPNAKLEIDTETGEALRINSTSGAGNIVRVDNTGGDTTPFIIDVNGNVGVNTYDAATALDVRGEVSVGNTLRIYDQDHSHYIGLSIGATTSDYTYRLPLYDGSAGHGLKTSGSGNLSWGYVSAESTKAGTGIGIQKLLDIQTGKIESTIANTGVTSITAGAGLTVTASTGDITISQIDASSGTLYPFTTRGFGYLL